MATFFSDNLQLLVDKEKSNKILALTRKKTESICGYQQDPLPNDDHMILTNKIIIII